MIFVLAKTICKARVSSLSGLPCEFDKQKQQVIVGHLTWLSAVPPIVPTGQC